MAKRDSKGKFLKGKSGNPEGVPKGLKQRSTQIKEAFFDAFEKTGGVKKLVKYIDKSDLNRKDFYALLVRMLPKEIEVDVQEPEPLTPQFHVRFTSNPRSGPYIDNDNDNGSHLQTRSEQGR
jgi:hypothetical protein